MVRIGTPDALIAYEKAFAKAVGQMYAVAFPYGRTALRILLESWGLKGADIICPAYTCVVVPHSVVASGNRPVFVDSAADANMDLKQAAQAIGPAARALIATSIFGHPVDLDQLDTLRRRHPNLLIIQDCAHSFDCHWGGRPVQAEGHAAIYGCNMSKIVTSIFGGLVTTNDDDLAKRLRALRARRLGRAGIWKSLSRALYLPAAALAFTPALYDVVDALRRMGLLRRLEDYYDPDQIDMPSDHLISLTPLEARIGAVQSKRLASFIAARRQYAASYHEGLRSSPALSFLRSPEGSSFSHIAGLVSDRRELIQAARKRGIELGSVIDYSCPEMPCYGLREASPGWPVAAFLARHVINLPAWGHFDVAVARRVISTLRPVLAAMPPSPAIPGMKT
jgi:dTDP-4-amino-4,6-dideoxygalactose transaminase